MSSWRVLQRRYCEQLFHQVLDPTRRCCLPPPLCDHRSARILRSRYHHRPTTANIASSSRGIGPRRWTSNTAAVVADVSASSAPTADLATTTDSEETRISTEEEKIDSSLASKVHFGDSGIGDPLDQLRIFYQTNYKKTISIRRDPKLFQRVRAQYENSSRIAWSAIFTCPISNETMASGTLIDWDDPPVASDQDDIVTYAKWKTAQQAAAGAFLDGVQLASTGQLGPRFCEETPRSIVMPASIAKEDKAPPEMTPIAQLHREFPKNYDGRKINNRHIAVLSVPSRELSLDSDDEEDESSAVFPSLLWSAMITCPLSGTKFPSSIYRDHDKTEYWVDDDIIYYSQKKEAIHSAAARFLDAIEYRKSGKDYDESKRLCSEHPSLLGDSLLTMDEDIVGSVDEVVPEENDLMMNSDEETSEEEEAAEEESSEEESYLPGLEGPLSDEEYVVSEVVEVSGDQTPADWLLEAATQNIGDRKNLSSQTICDPKVALEYALDFISSMQKDLDKRPPRSIHQLKIGEENPKVKLFRAKTVLLAIGDSVCISPVGINKVYGARAVANKVLSLLWKLEDGRPDADSYALFIRCHEDRNLEECIASVSRLIADMYAEAKVEGTEHRLPRPNDTTLNSFIQLNAQRGGTGGRFADHSEFLQPNRQSFLSVLSSAIYDPLEQTDKGGFDPEFARDCIDRMTEIYLETQDASMQPDTQVYNAPLRWASGPKLWLASRPYARSVPWDDYREIYKHGLRTNYHEDDLRIQEARNIGLWIDEMKQKAEGGEPTQPNIETYEAFIQSLLRTATRKGLEEAGQLFNELLEDGDGMGLQVRLQTLHPLLASWYHSDAPERWSKVSEFIAAWENHNGRKHVLDARLLELKILVLLSSLHQTKTLQQAVAVANEVTEIILNYDFQRSTPVNQFLFEKAMTAWEEVSELNEGNLDSSMICQIEAIFTLFEKNMRDATTSELFNDSDSSMWPSTLKAMCEKAPLFYGSIANVLSKTSNHSLPPSDNHKVSTLLSKVIRCSFETRAILKQLESESSFMVNSDYDNFNYRLIRLPHPPKTSRQEDFLMDTIAYFTKKGVAQPGNAGDLMAIYHCSSDFHRKRLMKKSGALLDNCSPGISKKLKGLFFQEEVDGDDGEHESKRNKTLDTPKGSRFRRINRGATVLPAAGRTKARPKRKNRASAKTAQ